MDNILSLIGNTPSVEILSKDGKKLFAKLEFLNPSGSVKDRASFYMLKNALARGDIKEGATIVEPTSGNTGIGIAMVAKAMGLKAVLVMPENMSEERRKIIKAYGAEIVLTPAGQGMKGATDKAKEIVATTPNSFLPNQFSNEDNVLAHFETTAVEIFSQTPSVGWIVAGIGSGGTVMGIKKYIIKNNIDCKVCGVEPSTSPLISKGESGAHKIQGIGANFIPELIDADLIDKISTVSSDEAFAHARLLASEYGILGGISAGASFAAALKLFEEEREDVLFIVPDTGLRYLSMGLYD